jgi:hypothetical protein
MSRTWRKIIHDVDELIDIIFYARQSAVNTVAVLPHAVRFFGHQGIMVFFLYKAISKDFQY